MDKEEIIGLRKRLGITQKELALKVGVDQVSINRYENGKSHPNKWVEQILQKLINTAKIDKTKPSIITKYMSNINLNPPDLTPIEHPKERKVLGFSKDKQIGK